MTTVFRCPGCGLPFARLEGGQLVIESRHHGETHINRLNVAALAALTGLQQYGLDTPEITEAFLEGVVGDAISDGPQTEAL